MITVFLSVMFTIAVIFVIKKSDQYINTGFSIFLGVMFGGMVFALGCLFGSIASINSGSVPTGVVYDVVADEDGVVAYLVEDTYYVTTAFHGVSVTKEYDVTDLTVNVSEDGEVGLVEYVIPKTDWIPFDGYKSYVLTVHDSDEVEIR